MKGVKGTAMVPGKGDTKSGSCWELARCSSRMSRLQEHIERFVRGSDASEADGLHLVYLLQVNMRDVKIV